MNFMCFHPMVNRGLRIGTTVNTKKAIPKRCFGMASRNQIPPFYLLIRRNPRHILARNEQVNVVGAFVGQYRF